MSKDKQLIPTQKPKSPYLGKDPTKPLPALIPDDIKELKIQKTIEAQELIYNNLPRAVQVLVDGLSSPEDWIRIQSANALIKKAMPDKKEKEEKDDKPIKEIDKREVVINLVNFLDEMGMKDLRERVHGTGRIFEVDPGRETEIKGQTPGKESTDGGGDRSGEAASDREGA